MSTAKKIAVAGATGRVGRHVVDILEAEGHDVVAISRSRGVDVITGDGLAEALAGVEAIVDAATGPSPEEQAATEFFTTAARNLQEAGAAGRRGADRRRVDHRHRPLRRRLRRRQGRPRAGLAVGPDPGARAARGAVPRVRRAAHGVGRARRRDLRAEDAHAAGRRPHRRRGARRPGHRPNGAASDARADPRDRRPARGAPRRDGDAARGPPRRRGARSRASSDPADPDQRVSTSRARSCPGPDAILAGPTFEEWLDEAA